MRLLELRENEKLTQSELARIIGISQSNYSKYEMNTIEPTLSTLIKLADFYKVSLDYLCEHTPKSQNSLDIYDLEILKKLSSFSPLEKQRVLGYIDNLLEK